MDCKVNIINYNTNEYGGKILPKSLFNSDLFYASMNVDKTIVIGNPNIKSQDDGITGPCTNPVFSDFLKASTDFTDENIEAINDRIKVLNTNASDDSKFLFINKKSNGDYSLGYRTSFTVDSETITIAPIYNTLGESMSNYSSDDIIVSDEKYILDKIYSDDGHTTEVLFDDIKDNEMTYYLYATVILAPVEPDPEPEPEEPVLPTIPYGQVFTINYNLKDGKINEENYPTSYICGVGVTLPTSVTKDNYEFIGWSTRNLSGVIITSISNRQYGDVYLNANYSVSSSAKKNTITFDLDGGTIVGDYPTDYLDEEITLPTKVTQDHAVFDGWYDNPEFSGKRIYKINASEVGNKKFYAKFVYEVYSIIYYLGYGKINEEYVTTYHAGEEITLPTNVSLDGSKFIGFSETEGDSNNLVTKINKGEVGTKVYYAVYESTSNNLTWLYWLGGGFIVVAAGIIATIVIIKKKRV